MFENIQSNPTNPDSGNNLNPNRGSDNQSNHKNILIGIGVLVLFIFILAGITIGMNTINKPKPVQTKIGNESMATSTENQAKVLIPTEEVASSTANQNNHKEITRAETLAYANFLKIDPTSIDSKINQIKLPINVKVDISNYYDVTRKINLDSYLNNLNKNGFSIIDNPFPVKGSNDFFTGFSALSDNQLPTLITSDFLLYYYQNTLKEVFESVKEENFYDELWDINKNLFDIADKRYRARLAVVGAVNDPILEAARKEAAFLAVTLEILKPKQDQVSANLNDTNKFNIKDLKKYYQVLPTYLKNDVPLEIDLMKEINTNNASQLIKKSPVLTYSKDYSQFILPEEYKKNAKLGNFYLAIAWLSSSFPLYYKNSTCPDCLLDQDDWVINQLSSQYLAKDLVDNQELKNRWAIIYKIISYFKGLRQGLTYIQLNDSFDKLFPGKSLEEIFKRENPNRDRDLSKLQDEIARYQFKPLAGGIDTSKKENLPQLGARLLQEQYWPNDYLFENLINVGKYTKTKTEYKKNPQFTTCLVKEEIIRCKPLALDIINLITNIPDDYKYFWDNTNYENYTQETTRIKKELSELNTFELHNNNYWNTLEILKNNFKIADYETPSYTKTSSWVERKINTSLGTWVNMHTPQEKWNTKIEQKDSFNLNSVLDYYIEPDAQLVRELKANTSMQQQMLLALKVINSNSYAFVKLTELTNRLEDISKIINNELNNKPLDYYDLRSLDNFIKKYTVDASASKKIKFYFKGNHQLEESTDGIKYVIITYDQGNKKKFSVGPIFNYQEY